MYIKACRAMSIFAILIILSLFAEIITWEREHGNPENSMHSPVYFVPTLEGSQPTLNWRHTFQIDGSPFLSGNKKLGLTLPPQRYAPLPLSDNRQNVFGFFRGINPAIPENNDLIMSFDLNGQQKWTKKEIISRNTSPTATQFDASISISRHKFLSGSNTSFYPLYSINSKQSFRIFDTTTGILFGEYSVPQVLPSSGSSNPVVFSNDDGQNLVIFGCGSSICGFTVATKIFTFASVCDIPNFSYDQPIAILPPANSGDYLRIVAVAHLFVKEQQPPTTIADPGNPINSYICSLAVDPKSFKVIPQFSWKSPFQGYLGVPLISSLHQSIILVEDSPTTQRTFSAMISNGTFLWENDKGTDWGHLQPVLSLGASNLYAITEKGEIFAFNVSTGLTKWRTYVRPSNLFSPVTVLNAVSPLKAVQNPDMLIVASLIDDLYYLTALDGDSEYLWEISGGLTIPAPNSERLQYSRRTSKSIGKAISPVAVGSDGSISFTMIHSPMENRTQNFATIVSSSQIHIETILPNHFYLIPSQSSKASTALSSYDVNIVGNFAKLKPSFFPAAKIECFFELETIFKKKNPFFEEKQENLRLNTDYFFKTDAKYINDTFVVCNLAKMPQEMLVVGKPVNLKLHWSFPTPNGKISNFFSNEIPIHFFSPPMAYKMFPIGVPFNQKASMISVFGLGFEQGAPQPGGDFSVMCRYEYKTSTVQFVQYQKGHIVSDKQLDCLAPEILELLQATEGETSNYMLKMYFSVDFDESSLGNTGVFFKTPFDLLLYQNPVIDPQTFTPKMAPMDSGSTVSFFISGDYLNQFQIQNNIKCGFSTTEQILPPDSVTPAKCIPKKSPTSKNGESAFCQCSTAKFLLHFNQKFHFWFSLNGVSFNRTDEIIEFYKPPIITAINPKEGNITTPTLCKISGDLFFESDGLHCKFGNIGVTKGTYSTHDTIFCYIPPVSASADFKVLGEAGKLLVPVSISENYGIDYSPNLNNVTFTYLVLEGCGSLGCGNGVCKEDTGKCWCHPMWAGERCMFPRKEGFWIYVGVYLLGLVVAFFGAILCLITYLRSSEMKYWKLIEETQANDISMIF